MASVRDHLAADTRDPDSGRLARSECRYGPFTLSLPPGLTAQALDEDISGTSWLRVGLIIDPADHGHDPLQIARHFDAYIAWLMARTGDHITLYGRDVAPEIAAGREPVLLPLWRELA